MTISFFAITDLPLSPRKSLFAQSHVLVRQHADAPFHSITSSPRASNAHASGNRPTRAARSKTACQAAPRIPVIANGDTFGPPSLAIRGLSTSKKGAKLQEI